MSAVTISDRFSNQLRGATNICARASSVRQSTTKLQSHTQSERCTHQIIQCSQLGSHKVNPKSQYDTEMRGRHRDRRPTAGG